MASLSTGSSGAACNDGLQRTRREAITHTHGRDDELARHRMRGRNAAPVVDHPGLAWWREARFGMFIHWGLYAIPAGVWEGEEVPGIGEWIMFRRRIPRETYAALAERFDPVRFDARAWVDLAVQAGMRYLVITSKHHDGFAIFRSPCCPYKHRRRHGPFGPRSAGGVGGGVRGSGHQARLLLLAGPGLARPGRLAQRLGLRRRRQGLRRLPGSVRSKPQLRELLTQYGPIGLIWFDTPYTISREHSIELRDLVHELPARLPGLGPHRQRRGRLRQPGRQPDPGRARARRLRGRRPPSTTRGATRPPTTTGNRRRR